MNSKELSGWDEVTDVTGVTVYCKKVNGYEREVYFNHNIKKWCFKKWTRTSGSFPEVGSRNTLFDCIKECEHD